MLFRSDLVAAYPPIRHAAIATGDLMAQGIGQIAYPFVNYPVESAVILGTPTVIAAGKGIYDRIRRH